MQSKPKMSRSMAICATLASIGASTVLMTAPALSAAHGRSSHGSNNARTAPPGPQGGGRQAVGTTGGNAAGCPATPAVGTSALSPTSVYVDFSEQTLLPRFGAALNAISAMDANSYQVMADGLPAIVSSATVNSTTGLVTLTLADGTLSEGTKVSVSYVPATG